jgi:hypothetical protein
VSLNNAPESASPDGPDVAGLGREVEALRRRLGQLDRLSECVDELTELVSHLADTAAVIEAPTNVTASTPSWLDFPADERAANDAEQVLSSLAAWVAGVYLRYRDAIRAFPDCWLWHPEVVEELLWLHRAWTAAYSGQAPPTAVGDWQERQRPGVVHRIREYAGVCSLEAHLPGRDRHTRAPDLPIVDAIAAIAAWWVTDRAEPGPEPTYEQLARAELAARNTAQTRR